MESLSGEILSEIVHLYEYQNKSSISLLYLSDKSQVDIPTLQEILHELEMEGYIICEEVNSRTLLIAPTDLGIQQNRQVINQEALSKKKDWGLIATLVSLFLAGLALIPGFYGWFSQLQSDFPNPSDLLVIENTQSKNSYSAVTVLPETYAGILSYFPSPFTSITILPDNNTGSKPIDPSDLDTLCLNGKNCPILFLLKPYTPPNNIRFFLRSTAKEIPLILDNLQVTLIKFKPINNPTKILFTLGGCGGGASFRNFIINDFPISEKPRQYGLPAQLTSNDPSKAIGQTELAQVVCDKNCDQYLYLNKDELEGINLEMPFLNNLPVGWYEFEAKVSYEYKNKSYVSNSSFLFDVVKPPSAHYSYNICGPHLNESFVNVDLVNREVRSSVQTAPLPNTNPGILVFHSIVALDEGFYTLDLQTGDLIHIGELGFVPSIWNIVSPSPDGMQLAIETENNSSSFTPAVNINLLDIKRKSIVNITPDRNSIVLYPSWSPSGKKMAYVKMTQSKNQNNEMDLSNIYVYDLNTKVHTQITFDSEFLKANPVWIDEQRIAFLYPKYTGKSSSTLNGKTGVGIVDVNTKVVNQISSTPVDQYMEYLSVSQKLALYSHNEYSLISLNGDDVFHDTTDLLSNCRFLNTLELPLLCVSTYEARIFDGITNGSMKSKRIAGDPKTANIGATTANNFTVNHDLLVGKVYPSGFIILDLTNNIIHQFSDDGNLVQDWSVPYLNKLLPSGQDDPILYLVRP